MTLAAFPSSPTAIALNRFGLGARPDEPLPGNPKRWLVDQFNRFEATPAPYAALPDAASLLEYWQDQQRLLRLDAKRSSTPPDAGQMAAVNMQFNKEAQQLYRDGVDARMTAALNTEAPFVERLVHFWANHFCVSADNAQIAAFAPAFERDAIRPHVLGKFEDMLLAAERHPAMLIYLNQVESVGPDSILAQRVAQRNPGHALGINENMGRETMELHTLGVRSGYTQTDVTEYSRALTGWTLGGFGPGQTPDEPQAAFTFRPNIHEPGVRTILGKSYDQDGEQQAATVLADFARSPRTAAHVAQKLARHFAGDTPSPSLVATLTHAFRNSGGDLPSVYRALVASPEPWVSTPVKFKTPWEWTVSTLRATGARDVGKMNIAGLQSQLGQAVWRPAEPAGWDDVAASWAAPDALLRRVELAPRLVAKAATQHDARTLGQAILPHSLSPLTAQQIDHAESQISAMALLMVSPDFLRR